MMASFVVGQFDMGDTVKYFWTNMTNSQFGGNSPKRALVTEDKCLKMINNFNVASLS